MKTAGENILARVQQDTMPEVARATDVLRLHDAAVERVAWLEELEPFGARSRWSKGKTVLERAADDVFAAYDPEAVLS